MKKVIIISYFYPPCNLTASQRSYGWAKNLSNHGYHPILITRNWDLAINSPEDVLKSSGKEVKHLVENNFEVYYLPYNASFRDRFYTHWKGSPMQKLSKVFTFFNLVFENFTTKAINHRNLYTFCKQFLKENPDVKKIIITGNPFNQFYFGYLLKKKFDIDWIADYRDDWGTSELKDSTNGFIKYLQRRSEKKWVKTAACITSISPHYTNKISEFVGVKGHTILNGFAFDEELPQSKPAENAFTITYNGSLYPSQDIETFLEAVKELIESEALELPIKLHFPGLAFNPSQEKRVREITDKIKENLIISDRKSRHEVLIEQMQSDLLIMISHTGIKGIPSSKLYEYIGLKKPILLYPNDHDIIESTINQCGLGIICEDKLAIKEAITKLINSKSKGIDINSTVDLNKIEQYSRKSQTEKLALLLDQI